tara:strand:- start:1240 stop:1686 length:447 start_codon:yes stop_codon:yes gene_type:complete
MARDIASNTNTVTVVDPVVVTSDTNGTGVDLQGFESAMLTVHTGVEGDTLSSSVKFEYYLEHSDDNSSFSAVTSSTDVTDASIGATGIFLTLDANGETPQIQTIGYIGGKRYVRVRIDVTGTHSNGTPTAIFCVKGNPQDANDSYSLA